VTSFRGLRRARIHATQRYYERRYGVSTDEHVSREALALPDEGSVQYEPAGWLTLRRALPRRVMGPDDVFADFGSGKGRVVFYVALRYPLKRVIGVEYSEELNRIARDNIERNRERVRARDVELVTTDARHWQVPDDLTIAFFHNPFTGPLFEDVATRLFESFDRRRRRLRIVYMRPIEHQRLMATGRVRETPFPSGGLGRVARLEPGGARSYEVIAPA
jgi:Histone methylation protein DOT1